MSWKGQREMQARIRAIAEEFPTKVQSALNMEMEIEATESKIRTPVDTGALRASIHTIPAQYFGSRIRAGLVCGGPAAPYAVRVHEDLDMFHDDGQAKFMESVLLESAPHMLSRVARRIVLGKL